MTKEEIKQSTSMHEVIRSYGIGINSKGLCHCPFHTGDRGASLKVYKDNFHCYGCHADGDIFKFVMLMDGCDFRTAFLKLGGSANLSADEKRIVYKNRLRMQNLRKKQQEERDRIQYTINEVSDTMEIYRNIMALTKKHSPEWFDAKLQFENLYSKYLWLRWEVEMLGR